MDSKQFPPDEVDTNSTSATDRDSTALHNGSRPAETVFSGVLKNNGPAVEMEKISQPDQATRPNGGWKAWLQVACGFFLYFNTYGAAAVVSNISMHFRALKVAG